MRKLGRPAIACIALLVGVDALATSLATPVSLAGAARNAESIVVATATGRSQSFERTVCFSGPEATCEDQSGIWFEMRRDALADGAAPARTFWIRTNDGSTITPGSQQVLPLDPDPGANLDSPSYDDLHFLVAFDHRIVVTSEGDLAIALSEILRALEWMT